MSIIIERTEDTEGTIGELVGEEFTKYALKNGIDTAYVEYCFVAKDEGKIAGVIQGHAYYRGPYWGPDCHGRIPEIRRRFHAR